jgi:hypothetical protein
MEIIQMYGAREVKEVAALLAQQEPTPISASA